MFKQDFQDGNLFWPFYPFISGLVTLNSSQTCSSFGKVKLEVVQMVSNNDWVKTICNCYIQNFMCKFDVCNMSDRQVLDCCGSGPGGFTFTWWGCYGLCLWHKPTELAHSFLLRSCIYFCLYSPFDCISCHKFSQQLSVFSLCSSGRISSSLVLSTICLFMKVSFSHDVIPNGWLGSKHQLTN